MRPSRSFLSILTCFCILSGCSAANQEHIEKQAIEKQAFQENGNNLIKQHAHQNNASRGFNPTSAKVGEKVAGLTITDIKIGNKLDDGNPDAVHVDFSGSIEVTGKYQYLPKEEVLGGEIVFEVNDSVVFPRMVSDKGVDIPRPDKIRLLFKSDAEKEQFGNPGTIGMAKIVLENFKIRYSQSDEMDTAEIKKIVTISKQDEPQKAEIKYPVFSATDYPHELGMIKKFQKADIDEVIKMDGSDKNLKIYVTVEDINHDGTKEILAIIQHPYFSGTNTNSYVTSFIVRDKKIAKEIFFGFGNIYVSDSGEQNMFGIIEDSKDGWPTVKVDNQKFVWNGERYIVEE